MVSEVLLAAIMFVESGTPPAGKPIPDGKAGEVGPLQIRQCVIDDVNETFHTNYTLEDARDYSKAADICIKYLNRYGTHYRLKEKREPSSQVLARIWNGGPSGWKRVDTLIYWIKVQNRMAFLLQAQLKEIDPRYRVLLKAGQVNAS